MDWVVIDLERILGAMTPGRKAEYDTWIALYPEKEPRIEELIANLVVEFRSGIEANPRNVLDADTSKLPQTCVRYCEEICLFEIATEMGAALSPGELQAVGKAEIFLRYMYSGRFLLTGTSGGGTPSYEAEVEAREARSLDG